MTPFTYGCRCSCDESGAFATSCTDVCPANTYKITKHLLVHRAIFCMLPVQLVRASPAAGKYDEMDHPSNVMAELLAGGCGSWVRSNRDKKHHDCFRMLRFCAAASAAATSSVTEVTLDKDMKIKCTSEMLIRKTSNI